MNLDAKKTVAITGAGKGLGAAYAKYLASKGLNVLVNNRIHPNQESSADLIVNEIKANGGNAIANYCSIEGLNSGQQILEQCLDEFGSFDYLINNAGVAEGKTFSKVTIEDFNRILEINLNGVINVTHACYKYMSNNNHGSIIFTTSGAGLYGQHGMPAYSCAKAGVIGLAHSLHLESLKKNININIISPFAHTNMTKNFLDEQQSKKFSVHKIVPLVNFLLKSTEISGNIFIAGAGKFKVAKMLENVGIDFSKDKLISEEEISNEIKSLLELTNLVTRNNASESFEAL
jgi:NAD(P)-dependent dehydrogenase (short-subunit alcohol dehydrogenase family)